jgi:hypothetical protein
MQSFPMGSLRQRTLVEPDSKKVPDRSQGMQDACTGVGFRIDIADSDDTREADIPSDWKVGFSAVFPNERSRLGF